MFEHDYTLVGKHATYVKFLAKEKDSKSDPDKPAGTNAGLFERYIDVYMAGAVFGLLYNRMASRDNSSSDRARVYADAFATCRDDCAFLYRMAMLLDESTDISAEERIDRAFRYDADPNQAENLDKNMDLFHSYVLGGIEILYEKSTEGCTTQEDYITRMYEMMKSFSEEIEGFPYEERLARLINA
ncbi:hypothetical protein SDC9_44341 [bioreactor metagenome]|uniref:Uncharacterized protein n=1 Tax=bioreactor metagenome TaxID=1076179 RepID=A0A644W356_9ZZZZ